MSPWHSIFTLARRSLICLAAAWLLLLAVYAGSGYLASQARNQQLQLQQLETESNAGLQEKQADVLHLQSEMPRFLDLRRRGLVGLAKREAWVEQLAASRQAAGLPDTLAYTLQPAKPLALNPDQASESAESPAPVLAGPAAHDLDFSLTGIHEQELLRLLSDYEAGVSGMFRVHACALSQPSETGLAASCTLRFFTLPNAAP